jgi:cyclopropane-fatty-acyl-phospholipid synthase
MFEHMRNWQELYARIARWLKPGGRFFKHIFVNRAMPYLFVDNGPGDWMSRQFFSGGMMPSDDLPLVFQRELKFMRRWRWDGTHYEKTANAWLTRMDANREALWPLFQHTYGEIDAQVWWNRWRIFFMACAELFGHDRGQQWWVSHYLFEKPDATTKACTA